MKISALGEFGLIDSIKKKAFRKTASVLCGIGDDAAVLKVSPSALLLATTDMLLEGVHFDLSYTGYYSLGWKSAAVNLSDIAAMGGVPRFYLTSLGIPPYIKTEQILDFYRGLNALMKRHKVVLVGGDTSSSSDGLIISITVLGEVEKRHVVSRAGAKPGDRIFVTGALGESSAGLEILKSGKNDRVQLSRKRPENSLKDKHLRPVPRIKEGRAIAVSRCASSMIDISDGLSSDLAHICDQSGVGASVFSSKIPCSSLLRKMSCHLNKAPLEYALNGGEDYELLFTVPPSKYGRFRSFSIGACEIGEITKKGMFIIDAQGMKRPLRPRGFDHFTS